MNTQKIINFFKLIISQLGENIGASVILLMSLAWNDVVQSALVKYFPLEKNTLKAKIIYAIIVTIIIILFKLYFTKNIKNKNKSCVKADDCEEGCGCEGFNF